MDPWKKKKIYKVRPETAPILKRTREKSLLYSNEHMLCQSPAARAALAAPPPSQSNLVGYSTLNTDGISGIVIGYYNTS